MVGFSCAKQEVVGLRNEAVFREQEKLKFTRGESADSDTGQTQVELMGKLAAH